MQDIIDFLRRLAANNNREWFTAHKEECKAVQAQFATWVEKLAARMAAVDPTLAGLTARDMTYRIYRDTRFSHDKTPYKTHMGAFICRGGKKSGYAGYYFQLGAEDNRADFGSFHWETQHVVAPGHYCIEPKALQVLREDIVYGDGDFDRLVQQAADARFTLLRENALKRNPKGFDKDAPWSEYIRLRNFCLAYTPTTAEVTAPDFADRLLQSFTAVRPFIDYINRAIDFAREEL